MSQSSQQQQQKKRRQLSRAITGAANNGSGLVRVTAVGHTFATGNFITIAGVGGTTEANGVNWRITVFDADNFDLVGSTFTNVYTSGGTAKRTAG